MSPNDVLLVLQIVLYFLAEIILEKRLRLSLIQMLEALPTCGIKNMAYIPSQCFIDRLYRYVILHEIELCVVRLLLLTIFELHTNLIIYNMLLYFW